MNSAAVVEGIRDLIARHKIKARDVISAISGHSVIIKKITLPTMTEDELTESIQWEAEQYIPFPISDVNIDDPAFSGGAKNALVKDVVKEFWNESDNFNLHKIIREHVLRLGMRAEYAAFSDRPGR